MWDKYAPSPPNEFLISSLVIILEKLLSRTILLSACQLIKNDVNAITR